jgi:hypothetical protein
MAKCVETNKFTRLLRAVKGGNFAGANAARIANQPPSCGSFKRGAVY